LIHPRKKILVVEDHDDTRRVVVLFLEMCKYDVQSAGTHAAAAGLLSSERFDVLVADIGLPDGSGLDLMRIAAAMKIKGIALTGRDEVQDVSDIRAAGFSVHLVKPADFASLKAAVERVSADESPPVGD
jgi:DNA-binding response OmpR family regulator